MTVVTGLRRALLCGGGLGLLLLTGCAQLPPRTPVSETVDVWQGRLALRVESEPPQSFFAGFELSGSPRAGQLTLVGPLGQTLGRLLWQPDGAFLDQGEGHVQSFASLRELAEAVTGTDLPVAALFDWLRGQPNEVAGWQADLSQLSAGRLMARRLQPAPVADLRLIIAQ